MHAPHDSSDSTPELLDQAIDRTKIRGSRPDRRDSRICSWRTIGFESNSPRDLPRTYLSAVQWSQERAHAWFRRALTEHDEHAARIARLRPVTWHPARWFGLPSIALRGNALPLDLDFRLAFRLALDVIASSDGRLTPVLAYSFSYREPRPGLAALGDDGVLDPIGRSGPLG